MSNAFGFNRHPVKPTPDSRRIGEALLKRRLSQPPGAGSPDSVHGALMASVGVPERVVGPFSEQARPNAMGHTAVPGTDDWFEGVQRQGEVPELDPAAMRHTGAKLMGGPGQTEMGLGDGEQGPSSINTAIGEALTRMGGGHQTSPNRHKPRGEALRMLQQHGLSEAEAMLMIRSGGA